MEVLLATVSESQRSSSPPDCMLLSETTPTLPSETTPAQLTPPPPPSTPNLQITKDKEKGDSQTKWRQYIAGVTASLSLVAGGAWFSWPAPLLPRLLGPDSPVPMTPDEASWMVSCIEVGSLFAPIPATLISECFGRKLCMLINVPLYLIALLLVNHVRTVFAMCVARTLAGTAMSASYTILPLYLGEIASPEARGTVTSFFHIAWGIGCLFPYCVGPYLAYETFNYAIFSLCLLFTICFIWQPESPYFYAMKKDSSELTKALKRLRDSPSEHSIRLEVADIEMEISKSLEDQGSWRDIVATPADRRALVLILIVGFVSFFSGQNAILTYNTETFSHMPNVVSADVITIGVGLSALVGSVLSLLISDSLGRRFLLLASSVGCTLSLAIASAYFFVYFNVGKDTSLYSWIAPLAVIGYNFFVTAGMHPVCVTYTSELFPTKTRGIASSISNLNLTFCSFAVLKLYQPISSIMGVYFIYLVYALTCLIGTVLFYFTMPETKGKSFLEIRNSLIKSQD